MHYSYIFCVFILIVMKNNDDDDNDDDDDDDGSDCDDADNYIILFITIIVVYSLFTRCSRCYLLTGLKKSPIHLATIKVIIIGRPKVISPVHSMIITVRLIVILTKPPS